jgi:radical SAM family RiPP maturation amino acid epimerase
MVGDSQQPPASELLELCREFGREIKKWEYRHRNGDGVRDPRLRFWRQQQITRCDSDIGAPMNSNRVHAPVCFELSDGCTVGCWFCAISADKFAGAFEYTPENARLWNEVLHVVRDIVGPAAQSGFCFWATDPFDNPDYEKLIADYHAMLGALPATTTAKAHMDIPRTRRLLRMWEDFGFTYNHFSILSVRILETIYEEFTPEELIWTGFNIVTKDAANKKAKAGRALVRLNKLSERGMDYSEIGETMLEGTIACVSGFLFNMVKKRIQLITPCLASEQWPNGYKILDEGTFADGADVRKLIERMIADNMPTSVRDEQILGFRDGLEYQPLPNGFVLASDRYKQNVEHPSYGRDLGEMIHSGSHTVSDILHHLGNKGTAPQEIRTAIDVLFKNCLLDTR